MAAVPARGAVPVPPVRAAAGGLVLSAAGVAAAAVLAVPGQTMVSLLLGLVAGALVLALGTPAWAPAAVLVTELCLSDYIPGTPVSTGLAVAAAAIAVTAPVLLGSGRLWDRRTRLVLLPAVAFVAVATVGNTVHSDADYMIKYLRYQGVQLASLVLMATLLRRRRDVQLVAGVGLAVAGLSAFAAVWQHFSRSTAIYGFASAATVAGWKGRVVGLSTGPVELSNDMTSILLPLMGVLLCSAFRLDRTRLLLATGTALLFGASYYTYTRSALMAAGAGLAAIGICLSGRRRPLILGMVVVALVMFPLLQGTGLVGSRFYRDASDDQSAASHLAAWEVGLALTLDHPLAGVGHEGFEQYSPQYASLLVSNGTVDGTGALLKGILEPHNDFLNVWMSWGLAAIGAYLALFLVAFVNLLAAMRSRDALVRGLAVGSIGGLLGYGISSSFHNHLDSSTYLWLYAGLSVSLARLADQEVRRRDALAAAYAAAAPRRRRLYRLNRKEVDG